MRTRTEVITSLTSTAAVLTAGAVLAVNPDMRHDIANDALGIQHSLSAEAPGLQRGFTDELHALRNASPVELALDTVARQKYGETVFVHCAELPGAMSGETRRTPSSSVFTIRLRPDICTAIGHILANPERVDPKDSVAAVAVKTVAHEESHTSGIHGLPSSDEDVTECLGVQRTPEVAEALGIPKATAEAMGGIVALLSTTPPLPAYAIPLGCSPGGAYDVHAADAQFPPGLSQ